MATAFAKASLHALLVFCTIFVALSDQTSNDDYKQCLVNALQSYNRCTKLLERWWYGRSQHATSSIAFSCYEVALRHHQGCNKLNNN